jgi:hypothetical protein
MKAKILPLKENINDEETGVQIKKGKREGWQPETVGEDWKPAKTRGENLKKRTEKDC